MQDDLPEDSKLTRTKRAWAGAGKFLTGRAARPEAERLPPGQHLVTDWPVLDLGVEPEVPLATWQLRVGGFAASPLTLTWEQFTALTQHTRRSDIHCVTTWSRYDNDWQGVPVRALLDLVQPLPMAAFVLLTSHDGYTTNLPLEDFASEDAMLATHWQGQPLTRAHGGPMRLVVPHLYFWKSAKWLKGIELIGADRAGFWERNGYHMYGDPWREQRYSDD
ncbi:molybdopterin-dependent oxidoreductase [Frigidibacter albus]|uniref:Molybdopterin-dependent oxidoreductase n=1 Tax=Frigidibacter albus TaxID=1465486 RepID=A0A6L8VKD3_9RHOB|nr:sulfite oxidase-like oxidoreductase [Frigidibacter albus]MZQ90835.1 molybdopterin-dependent oxidoreductase [Frigidibacter albus]NBE32547.1 molybdopterin-dependent oxidoreductase [Frigidibacter albus]GGH61387.1 sulfite oxidase-like oxidoreductase [Frigidibacter albus]